MHSSLIIEVVVIFIITVLLIVGGLKGPELIKYTKQEQSQSQQEVGFRNFHGKKITCTPIEQTHLLKCDGVIYEPYQ